MFTWGGWETFPVASWPALSNWSCVEDSALRSFPGDIALPLSAITSSVEFADGYTAMDDVATQAWDIEGNVVDELKGLVHLCAEIYDSVIPPIAGDMRSTLAEFFETLAELETASDQLDTEIADAAEGYMGYRSGFETDLSSYRAWHGVWQTDQENETALEQLHELSPRLANRFMRLNEKMGVLTASQNDWLQIREDETAAAETCRATLAALEFSSVELPTTTQEILGQTIALLELNNADPNAIIAAYVLLAGGDEDLAQQITALTVSGLHPATAAALARTLASGDTDQIKSRIDELKDLLDADGLLSGDRELLEVELTVLLRAEYDLFVEANPAYANNPLWTDPNRLALLAELTSNWLALDTDGDGKVQIAELQAVAASGGDLAELAVQILDDDHLLPTLDRATENGSIFLDGEGLTYYLDGDDEYSERDLQALFAQLSIGAVVSPFLSDITSNSDGPSRSDLETFLAENADGLPTVAVDSIQALLDAEWHNPVGKDFWDHASTALGIAGLAVAVALLTVTIPPVGAAVGGSVVTSLTVASTAIAVAQVGVGIKRGDRVETILGAAGAISGAKSLVTLARVAGATDDVVQSLDEVASIRTMISNPHRDLPSGWSFNRIVAVLEELPDFDRELAEQAAGYALNPANGGGRAALSAINKHLADEVLRIWPAAAYAGGLVRTEALDGARIGLGLGAADAILEPFSLTPPPPIPDAVVTVPLDMAPTPGTQPPAPIPPLPAPTESPTTTAPSPIVVPPPLPSPTTTAPA